VVHLPEPVVAGGSPTRVAYAIPRSVGSAVVRNRLRRRLRAVCEHLASTRDGLPPGALLISAGPDAARRTPDELRHDVARLFDALEQRRSPESR
jgi:ribonuclease P protein component